MMGGGGVGGGKCLNLCFTLMAGSSGITVRIFLANIKLISTKTQEPDIYIYSEEKSISGSALNKEI